MTTPVGPGPLPIGTEIGHRHRFRLDRWIGGGAFGGVYEATTIEWRDADVPDRVAVKVLSSDLSLKVQRHALSRELSSLLAIRSRRIPQVYDGSVEPPSFIAMELFPNGTLDDLQRRMGPLDEHETVGLAEGLIEALDAAHSAGVLHLDVKPANVLLGSDGQFVLADFGVSQASRMGDLPMAGLGSQGWQAPEQESGRRDQFDLRTDLFGAGATLWSALTGIDLASRQGQLARKRAAGSPLVLPPINFMRRPPIAEGFDAIVNSLIARDPADRPGSAGAVLNQFRALRGGTSVRVALPGFEVGTEEARRVVNGLVDPLVTRMLGHDLRGLRRLDADQALCLQGERGHHAFVLLVGEFRVLRDGVEVSRVMREGELLGEIAALTGEPRGAALVATMPTWVRVLDAAQLEALVAANPALAVRLIRTMAARFKQLDTRRPA